MDKFMDEMRPVGLNIPRLKIWEYLSPTKFSPVLVHKLFNAVNLIETYETQKGIHD